MSSGPTTNAHPPDQDGLVYHIAKNVEEGLVIRAYIKGMGAWGSEGALMDAGQVGGGGGSDMAGKPQAPDPGSLECHFHYTLSMGSGIRAGCLKLGARVLEGWLADGGANAGGEVGWYGMPTRFGVHIGACM